VGGELMLFTAILCGLLAYLIFTILWDLSTGNRGEKGHLKKYYSYLMGKRKEKKSWLGTFLRLNKDQMKYVFNTKKYLLYATPVCFGIFLFVLFFFRNGPFALVISLIGLFYPRWIISGMIEKRRNLLNMQLREAMFSLTSSLLAGASLQRSIERSVIDLERIFHSAKDTPIVYEFRRMAEDLSMGYSLEETMVAFRDRVRLEDADDFVNATLITKRRGGNLTEVLSNISKIISEKIEIKNEILVMTAGKRMEAKILSIMPIGIVTCLTLLSPEYMSPMYDSIIGKFLMFIGFLLIGLNYIVSRKMIKIDV
jgi:tight adherence protein B